MPRGFIVLISTLFLSFTISTLRADAPHPPQPVPEPYEESLCYRDYLLMLDWCDMYDPGIHCYDWARDNLHWCLLTEIPEPIEVPPILPEPSSGNQDPSNLGW